MVSTLELKPVLANQAILFVWGGGLENSTMNFSHSNSHSREVHNVVMRFMRPPKLCAADSRGATSEANRKARKSTI
jgi:hypothetical protein